MQSNLDKAKKVSLVCFDCIILIVAGFLIFLVALTMYATAKTIYMGWHEGKAAIEKSK